MGGSYSLPWREFPQDNKQNLNFVRSYQPKNADVKYLRVLLHGPVGAGKSSFINSADTVLQGEIMSLALTDGCLSDGSFTRKYINYRMGRDSEGEDFAISFNDISGVEESGGIKVDDIILALKGHVKEGYEFKPSSPLNEGHEGYNPTPTLQDRVHVLVSVIPGDGHVLLSENVQLKMRQVRKAASDLGIPQLAIVTKVDAACTSLEKNMDYIYMTKHLKRKASELSTMLGIPMNCIFLVKNYDNVTKIDEKMDAPILCVLRQIIIFGERFLNNMK